MPYNTAPIGPRKDVTGAAQLPLARVKKIIAQDPDISMCSNNAAFVITLATEMFIQYLAEQGHNVVKAEKKPRRNIQYRDLGLANAVARHDTLEFLSDVVPRTVAFKEVKARAKANGNTLGHRSAESGQTTLDGKKVLVNGNGTNGKGPDGLTDDNGDDDSGMADPSLQLEMEIRGMRAASSPTDHINDNGTGTGSTAKEDVEMS